MNLIKKFADLLAFIFYSNVELLTEISTDKNVSRLNVQPIFLQRYHKINNKDEDKDWLFSFLGIVSVSWKTFEKNLSFMLPQWLAKKAIIDGQWLPRECQNLIKFGMMKLRLCTSFGWK